MGKTFSNMGNHDTLPNAIIAPVIKQLNSVLMKENNMKKIVSNLMLAGLFTIGLAACNSGGGATSSSSSINTASANANQSNTNNIGETSKASFGNAGTIINMLGGDIIHGFINPVTGVTDLGTQLLGLLTNDAFPSNPPDELAELEQENAQIFSSIESNFNTIENTLTTQNQLLQTIYQTILNQNVEGTQTTLNELQTSLPNAINSFNSVIARNGATQLPTLLNANNNATLTLSQNDLSALLIESSIKSFNKNFSQLDFTTLNGLEQIVSGDNSNQYSVNNPSIHGPFPTANYPLLDDLSAAYTAYTTQVNNNFQNGIFNGNLFESQYAWNNTVDSIILGMVTTLNAAYRVDQVKLYLYYNTGVGIAAPSVIYTPDLDNGYQAALADLTYAYNQRLANLAALDSQYKTAFWNQYFPSWASELSGPNTCNFNNTYLSSLKSGGTMGSWNGLNLTISCQGTPVLANGQQPQPVVNTNFTPSLACKPNSNGTYSDLMVTKAGYIICGTQPQDWNKASIDGTIATQSPHTVNIASSQYSYSYIFEPAPSIPTHNLQEYEQMYVTFPGFVKGSIQSAINGTGLALNEIYDGNFPNSGLWNWNYNQEGTLYAQVDGSLVTPFNDFSDGGTNKPVIYYDNYHALALTATSNSYNASGVAVSGAGVAIACIPGLSDCTGSGTGGSFSNFVSVTNARNLDQINFANGDTLQMQVTSTNIPTPANPIANATIQYINQQP